METYYSVTRKGKPCGKGSGRKQGLYHLFDCRCLLDCNEIYRLNLTCGDFQKDLGILVPTEGTFGIHTKIPSKQLREGEWGFCVIIKKENPAECFVPISPEEPFTYISRVKASFLIYQNGQAGIEIERMQKL